MASEITRLDSDLPESGTGRQAQKSARMRSAILDEAVQRLAGDGYHATSIKKIAANGDFSIGAIQHHFATREDLMVAVVERALDRAERYVERFVERGGKGIAGLVHASWSQQINSPLYLAMLEVFVAARTDAALRSRIAPAILAYGREAEERIAAKLAGPGADHDRAAFLLTVSRCMMGGFLAQDALAMPKEEIAAFIGRWAAFLEQNLTPAAEKH